MVPGNYHSRCTATSCPRCGFDFNIDATNSTTYTATTYRWDCWVGASTLIYTKPRPLTRTELAMLRATERALMAPPIIQRAPRAVMALNTGMHIRRMRASCGLARART